MASAARVGALNGPVGAGKTTTCLQKLLKIAAEMPVAPDGQAYCRFGIIRDTYRNLAASVIQTWHKIVSPAIGRWVGGGTGDPAIHNFQLRLPSVHGTKIVNVEMQFFALGDHTLEHVLRGREFTAVYVNEADMLPPDTIAFLLDRVGRYPEKARGGGFWQILADFNAPEPDNWIYEAFWTNKPESYALFVQPGGRDPGAENMENLRDDYYSSDEQLAQPAWKIRTMIDNKPGFRRRGTAVFPEYNDRVHCAAKPLLPIPSVPLLIGVDCWYRPAATIWQRIGTRWRGLAEFYGNHMGPNSFGEGLSALLARDFRGFTIMVATDPTSIYGDPDQEDSSQADIIGRKLGVKLKPAPTNAIGKRLDALRIPMQQFPDGDRPNVIISPTMVMTRAGLNGRYQYREKKTNDRDEEDTPAKTHPISDLMDSAQYCFLTFGDYHEVEARGMRAGARKRFTTARTQFNVFARPLH